MKKILIPTDFSTCASNALNFAIQSSKIFPLELVVIYVLEQLGSTYVDFTGLTADISEDVREQANERLIALKSKVMSNEKVFLNTKIYQTPVAENIIRAATDELADLIVMGAMEDRSLTDKLWGSHTGAVIAKSTTPIMVIPSEYKWRKPARIMLATNHFERNPAVLDFLIKLATLYNAEIHIVVFTDERKDIALVLEHGHKISAYKSFIEKQYQFDVVAQHIYGDNFEQALSDYISEEQIDVLAMVTYHRKLWDRLFHPSVSKKMSYHTKIPLLVIPFNADDESFG